MSNLATRLGGRLILKSMLLAVVLTVGGALSAAVVGSQAANMTFSNVWGPAPSGTTQLDDYFAPPGYVTLVELWSPT